MSTTRGAIKQEVILLIGQVSGTSVQTYEEPILDGMIQRGFNFAFDMRFWADYTSVQTYTLDGTNGVVTADLSALKEFRDIKEIYINGTSYKIVQPLGREHLLTTGADPRYVTWKNHTESDYATKRFTVWPKTASKSVDITWRARPDDFANDTDIIYLDKDMLVLWTTWMALLMDDMNDAHAAAAKSLGDSRYDQIVGGDSNIEIGHGVGERQYDSFTIS